MGVTVHEARDVFYVSGELDAAAAEEFDAAIAPALEGRGQVVLDLGDLTFIDSTGVRTLALLSRRVGGGLVLRYPQDTVMRVLELLQIDEMPGIRLVHD